MRNPLLIVLLCLSLAGCAPCALVAGVTGTNVFTDRRDIKTQWQDTTTSHKINYWIANNPDYNTRSHISVATVNGVVLLAGQAHSIEIHDAIYQHVENVEGVKRIYDRIDITQPTSVKRQAEDAWLTTKIKTAMLNQEGLNSTAVKVVSENGVAYLMGIVGHDEGDKAAEITSHVPGVQKVVKLFEYVT